MQRLSRESRVPKEHHATEFDIENQQYVEKPYFFSGNSRTKSPFKSLKLIHIVPAIVLFCIFILWYFSYPVNLEIKDGRLTKIHRIEMPRSMNDTQVDLTILTKATSPNVSVSDMLIANTTTAPQPASATD